MRYMIITALSNAQHPEYGQVTIPFPVPNEEYDRLIEMLGALEIGDALKRDCHIDGIDSFYTVLNQLHSPVSFDELDYLAKRLDSFDNGEAKQFQTMAHKLALSDIKDFINLTFCCQQATVISDFSKLEQAGRDLVMNLNGGAMPAEELEALDGYETALLLIDTGAGVVTPYGAVYDNGMRLEQLYNGQQFPGYLYGDCVMGLELIPEEGLQEGKSPELLCLPASQRQLERAMLRAGMTDFNNVQIHLAYSGLPECINTALDMDRETPDTLNALCKVICNLKNTETKKLEAVMPLAGPENAKGICHLAENLDLFEFLPGIQTIEAYGRYMIRTSGMFAYDDKLEGFYDYQLYGKEHIHPERGQFNACGYVEYKGSVDLSELLRDAPAEQHRQEQGPQMGGLA